MKRTVFIFALVIMTAGLTACGNQSEARISVNEEQSAEQDAVETDLASYNKADIHNTITVNSSEEVSVVPDIAEVVYSVRTKESTASGCQQKNAEEVSQVIELLKGLGVEEASIQTSDYYMNPVYNYSGSTPKLTGYEAISTLTVSDLPIEDLDSILAQSVSTGINTVQSITYQASQYDKSYQEALTKAVASAYSKAQALAEAAGAKVGNVISIQETSGYSEARYTDYARTGALNASAKQEAMMDMAESIMPGEIQVEAGIIVEYQLIYE